MTLAQAWHTPLREKRRERDSERKRERHFFTRAQAWQLHEILLDHVRAWALASRGLFLRPAAAAAAAVAIAAGEDEGPPEYVRYTAGLPDSEIRWAQVLLAHPWRSIHWPNSQWHV